MLLYVFSSVVLGPMYFFFCLARHVNGADQAIKGWINRTGKGRTRLVSEYFNAAGGFGPPETVQRAAE